MVKSPSLTWEIFWLCHLGREIRHSGDQAVLRGRWGVRFVVGLACNKTHYAELPLPPPPKKKDTASTYTNIELFNYAQIKMLFNSRKSDMSVWVWFQIWLKLQWMSTDLKNHYSSNLILNEVSCPAFPLVNFQKFSEK